MLQLRGLERLPLVLVVREPLFSPAVALALDGRRDRVRVAEELLRVAHAVVADEEVESFRNTPQRMLPHEHIYYRIVGLATRKHTGRKLYFVH